MDTISNCMMIKRISLNWEGQRAHFESLRLEEEQGLGQAHWGWSCHKMSTSRNALSRCRCRCRCRHDGTGVIICGDSGVVCVRDRGQSGCDKVLTENALPWDYSTNNSSPSAQTSRTVDEKMVASFGDSVSPMTQCGLTISQATKTKNWISL